MKHSELPWTKSWFMIKSGEIGQDNFRKIAVMQPIDNPSDEDKQNAEFIIRAVNNFYSMLEALKNAQLRLEGAGMLGGMTDPVNHAITAAEKE